MKITQIELNRLASALLVSGSRIGSVTLTVDGLRKAVESGNPASNGVHYDTPKLSVLESAVANALSEYAQKLVVAGSTQALLSESAKTYQRKGTDTIAIQRLARYDLGEAKPAVAWLHRLRAYISAIVRDGAQAVSAKTRGKLVKEFNALAKAKAQFACLNVSDDKQGFGLAKAKGIIGNMAAAETEAQAQFAKRQVALAANVAVESLKAVKTGKRNRKTRKPVSVVDSVRRAVELAPKHDATTATV